MPNHVKNQIDLTGSIEMLDEMVKIFGTYHKAELKLTDDKQSIICQKEGDGWGFCWMDIKTGYCHDRKDIHQNGLPEGYMPEVRDSFLAFPDFSKVIPPPDDPAYRDEPSQEVAKTSPNWWYNWNVQNWGSKWGAYSYNRLGLVSFSFETAWSPCPIIIEAMSKRFPSVTIVYKWADEDTGYNCGKSVYLNGLLSNEEPEGGSKEAYEIAFELRSHMAENYELVDGKYQYKEND